MVAMGRAGIQNFGNTCFMSSGLQCLAHIAPLLEFFKLNNQFECNGFAAAFRDLLRCLWKPKSDCNSARLPEFFRSRFEQCGDAAEFVLAVLEGLHQELSKKKAATKVKTKQKQGEDEKSAEQWWEEHRESNSSIIADLFHGQCRTSIRCAECSKILSSRFECFVHLALPIARAGDGSPSLQSCLEELLREETLTLEKPDLVCPKCSKKKKNRQALLVKKLDLCRLPDILIIQVNRYFLDEKTDMDCPVEHWDLTGYSGAPSGTQQKYDPFAVIEHCGDLDFGHYTATIKLKDKWYKFDDEKVSSVPNASTSYASVFFYTRNQIEKLQS